MITTQLLYISIGPVQEFIASARRCQDLWYGSYLLSQLSEACASAIEADLKHTNASQSQAMIFPAELSHVSSMESMVANKILFELSNASPERARDLARIGKNAVQERLKKEQTLAFGKLMRDPHAQRFFQQNMAEAQLNELIEFAWVSLPVDQYQRARIDADAILSARKMSKVWTQVSWNHGLEVPKSSLDGGRESVIHEDAYNEGSPANLRRLFGVKRGERLCGVALLKRLGAMHSADDATSKRVRPAFHSTSHLAAAPLLTALSDPTSGAARREALNAYVQALKALNVDLDRFRVRAGSVCREAHVKGLHQEEPRRADRTFAQETGDLARPLGFDGYLMYESRLEEVLSEGLDGFEALSEAERKKLVTKAQGSLRACLSTFDLNADSLCKYYAVILADGDHMGAAIDAMKTPDQHRALSAHLNKFASACRELVESRGGSLIYAGGDDVLALVPLHTALDVAHELKTSFEKHLQDFCAHDDVKGLITHQPTLSVGLSIAHHLDSMSYALNLARGAERKAKEAGRNALSIVVSRRSGGDYEAVGSWSSSSREPHTLHERLYSLIELTCAQALPHGVAHELQETLTHFQPRNLQQMSPQERSQWREQCRAPLWREVRRVIKRKNISQGSAEATDAQKALISSLQPFSEPNAPDLADRVTQLCDELLIAKLLSEGYRNAWGATPSSTSRSEQP